MSPVVHSLTATRKFQPAPATVSPYLTSTNYTFVANITLNTIPPYIFLHHVHAYGSGPRPIGKSQSSPLTTLPHTPPRFPSQHISRTLKVEVSRMHAIVGMQVRDKDKIEYENTRG